MGKDFHIGTQRLLTVQISCMQCFTKSVRTVTILRNNVFVPCLFLSDTAIDTDTEGLLFVRFCIGWFLLECQEISMLYKVF